MNNDHFAAFTCGFITAWIVCGFEVVNMTPRRRRKPLPRDQDPDWRRSFNHDNTNKKPTSPPPLLFRPRPPRKP